MVFGRGRMLRSSFFFLLVAHWAEWVGGIATVPHARPNGTCLITLARFPLTGPCPSALLSSPRVHRAVPVPIPNSNSRPAFATAHPAQHKAAAVPFPPSTRQKSNSFLQPPTFFSPVVILVCAAVFCTCAAHSSARRHIARPLRRRRHR